MTGATVDAEGIGCFHFSCRILAEDRPKRKGNPELTSCRVSSSDTNIISKKSSKVMSPVESSEKTRQMRSLKGLEFSSGMAST